MACISPPELDDQTLLSFLDGRAPATVAAHVEQCDHCRESAQHLAHLQVRWLTLLYRLECPSPTELGEYHLGTLPASAADAITQHLPNCPRCRREIAQLEDYLISLEPAMQPDPLQEVVERARVWVARLVSGGLTGGPMPRLALAPSYAGLRGDVTRPPSVYEAGDAQVIVEIREDTERADQWDALGLLIGLDETLAFEAQLWLAQERVTTAQLDELGNFVLSGLASGVYKLVLAGPDLEIHIQAVQVGPTEREP